MWVTARIRSPNGDPRQEVFSPVSKERADRPDSAVHQRRIKDVGPGPSYGMNLLREEFLSSDLATLYRCRWEVELLFRE
jgi:IS4 transposase